jgi:hypothetical protein
MQTTAQIFTKRVYDMTNSCSGRWRGSAAQRCAASLSEDGP